MRWLFAWMAPGRQLPHHPQTGRLPQTPDIVLRGRPAVSRQPAQVQAHYAALRPRGSRRAASRLLRPATSRLGIAHPVREHRAAQVSDPRLYATRPRQSSGVPLCPTPPPIFNRPEAGATSQPDGQGHPPRRPG